MAKITLTDGTIIEGTAEELIELQQATGTAEYTEEKSTEALKDSPQAETQAQAVRVGDYVVFDERHMDVIAGKPYKVTEVRENVGGFYIKDDAGDDHVFAQNSALSTYKRYRPIEGAPQVGDKILVVNKRGGPRSYSNGSILTISEIHSVDRSYAYTDEAVLGLFRHEYVIIERAGEHIPQEPTPEIEEGDIVRVIKEGVPAHFTGHSHGDIGVVVSLDGVGGDNRPEVLVNGLAQYSYVELIAKKADRKDLAK